MHAKKSLDTDFYNWKKNCSTVDQFEKKIEKIKIFVLLLIKIKSLLHLEVTDFNYLHKIRFRGRIPQTND